MFPRTILFSILILLCSSAALAQRPGPQFWRRATCESLEPRTALERLDNEYSTIIIKGFSRLTTVDVRGVRVDLVEIRDMADSLRRTKGIVVVLREGGEHPNDNRAFVDYSELDQLLNAIDMVGRVDETATKLASFEAKYKTLGDLEIDVFRQTRSGTAVVLTTGICDRATQTLTLDDLAKFKALIQEAKTRLDDIR